MIRFYLRFNYSQYQDICYFCVDGFPQVISYSHPKRRNCLDDSIKKKLGEMEINAKKEFSPYLPNKKEFSP